MACPLRKRTRSIRPVGVHQKLARRHRKSQCRLGSGCGSTDDVIDYCLRLLTKIQCPPFYGPRTGQRHSQEFPTRHAASKTPSHLNESVFKPPNGCPYQDGWILDKDEFRPRSVGYDPAPTGRRRQRYTEICATISQWRFRRTLQWTLLPRAHCNAAGKSTLSLKEFFDDLDCCPWFCGIHHIPRA